MSWVVFDLFFRQKVTSLPRFVGLRYNKGELFYDGSLPTLSLGKKGPFNSKGKEAGWSFIEFASSFNANEFRPKVLYGLERRLLGLFNSNVPFLCKLRG